MKILNLGCGVKTSDHPGVVNIDWSTYLRLKRLRILHPVIPLFLHGEQLRRFRALPDNIRPHNLAKGIPFDNATVDVVYHSHLFEHLDPDVADGFLHEVQRVLKPGGIHRIVVPDFELLCQRYLQHLAQCEDNPDQQRKHDNYVFNLLEQSVRKEAFSSRGKRPLRRRIENLFLGDARKRGETHQWMYDRINLTAKLEQAGYREIQLQRFDTSQIPDWNSIGLDLDGNGGQYKPGSLYVEAINTGE